MRLTEYQQLAERTLRRDASSSTPRFDVAIAALGIAGEAGEVADYLKKVLGHGHTFDAAHLAKELGDVLWYVAALATLTGLDLDEVARLNVEKLRRRYPAGFSAADSIARRDVTP